MQQPTSLRQKTLLQNFTKIYNSVVVFLAVALTVLPTIVVGDFQQWLSRALVFLVASLSLCFGTSVPLTFLVA